ncbi:MAG TPA: penicillin-binding protein 2 [Ilumatobacteraceae bacterium]|nr:penicillin-binding protein 2 [Ilumatobacteraceae bacterium]
MASTTMMPDDRRSLTLRLSFMQYAVALAFAALAVAFWIFQIAQHEHFREIADSQYLQRLPLPAPRGVLFDRNGRILVENTTTFNIALLREQVKDVDRTLRVLAEATGADLEQFRETVNRRRRDPSYRPVVLIDNASLEQVIAAMARKPELPGIIYQQVPTRKYSMNEMAAHLFGYVGEVREEQLLRAEYQGVESGTIVGQSGIEQVYNRLLMGTEGIKSVIVNSVGREIEQVSQQNPKEGRRLQLTIDADLQKAAEDGFRHFGEVQSGGPYNGAAVVLDPRSGEVLSMVSLPAYDPNKFAVGIDAATWKSLNSDPLRPLNNRALQGRYSPGSTFKIVVATAALEEGVATPETRVHCSGGAVFYGRYFQCHLKGGHGTLDMRQGIEKSCNVYFYTLGNMVGIDRLAKWAANLGLADRTGIDLPNEVQSIMPSTEWKRRVHKDKWYAGETISVAIGQGYVSSTPLSLATMMMTVANGGTRYTPHVLKAVDEGQGWKPAPPPAPKSVVRMKESTIKALHDGLWMVVNGAGTGGRARLPGRDISGKTGTAQVISITGAQKARGKIDVRDHGWFVFFAPRDNPEIAGAIFTEHSQHGYYGGPIAKHIVETYFAKKEGKPLPVLVKPVPTTIIAANR